MKQQILEVLRNQFQANIGKHRMNIEIMLANPMAIHDHTDFTGAIELEIAQIAEYEDKLEVLSKYFIS